MNSQPFVIRQLRPDEAGLLKSLRLSALASDPESYWESLTEAQAYDAAYWARFASKLTQANGSVMFILESADQVAGFVFGIRKSEDEYRIGGLWIDPDHRRKALGSALVQRVVSWARAEPTCRTIQLWCPVGPTVSFYEENGFQPLGNRRINDTDGREIVELEWREATRA